MSRIRKAGPLASTVAQESASLKLKISVEKHFLLLSCFSLQWPPSQDMHCSFPTSLAILSCYCWMKHNIVEGSQVRPTQSCMNNVSLSDLPEPGRGSLLQPITIIKSFCALGSSVCLIWCFLHHSTFCSICYFSPANAGPPLVSICPGRSWKAAETYGADCSISPVFSPGICNGEEGKSGELGEWSPYLKEKGLGRISFCTLHSTSLRDY